MPLPLFPVQIVQMDFATTGALVAIVSLESVQQTALLIWIPEEGEGILLGTLFFFENANLMGILQYATRLI